MHTDDPYGGGSGPLGWALRQVAIWGGIGLVLYAVAGNRTWFEPSRPLQAEVAQSAPASQPSQAATNTLTYHADQRGHVFLEAVVNGAPVRFLVDTGASFVALTPTDAAAAGLGNGNSGNTVTLNTANGQAHAALVSLREVRIGQLAIDNVQGVVQERLPMSLLGQSFLKRLNGYEMHDGVLTINWQ